MEEGHQGLRAHGHAPGKVEDKVTKRYHHNQVLCGRIGLAQLLLAEHPRSLDEACVVAEALEPAEAHMSSITGKSRHHSSYFPATY